MLQIRDAEPADVPIILGLIRELAVFEKLEHEAQGRIEDLRQHLFAEPRFAHAILAFKQQELAGFALYYFTYSTFQCRPGLYLEDLFVRPQMRGQGIGMELMQDIERRARLHGCGRFEWSVLDWNQSAIDFYERLGARPVAGWTRYRKVLE